MIGGVGFGLSIGGLGGCRIKFNHEILYIFKVGFKILHTGIIEGVVTMALSFQKKPY